MGGVWFLVKVDCRKFRKRKKKDKR